MPFRDKVVLLKRCFVILKKYDVIISCNGLIFPPYKIQKILLLIGPLGGEATAFPMHRNHVSSSLILLVSNTRACGANLEAGKLHLVVGHVSDMHIENTDKCPDAFLTQFSY